MIYLKLYAKDKDYQDVLSADQLLLPNVSHTIDANEVYYNPIQGANEIWYTSVNGGKVYVNPDSFSGATGELLTVQSHIYADGIGRILFSDNVVSIGEDAFYYRGAAPQSIDDEGSPVVANIATYRSPFEHYDDLLTITFPDGVKDLKEYALNGSSYLREINIPETVVSIAENAISQYATFDKINVASGNTSYSSEGNCLTRLSDRMLLKGTNTTTIPNNVKAINDYAFRDCSSLTGITIPNSIISIGDYAFSGCSSLTKIVIPDSVTSIGESTFDSCLRLSSAIIGNSIAIIESYAFSDCSSLTGITIPDNVTAIGDGAFSNCSSLTGITIPDNVTAIGDGAFSDCSSLTGITIPDNVTAIGDSMFYGCSSLSQVTLGNNIATIGERAFNNCTSLVNINIPNSVTTIGRYAFCNSKLSEIIIPDSVTDIGGYCFSSCPQLNKAIIGKNMSLFRDYLFYNCSNLQSITINKNDYIIQLGDNGVFLYCPSKLIIYVPSSLLNRYKGSTDHGNWSKYNIQAIPSE